MLPLKLLLVLSSSLVGDSGDRFIVAPYVQLGPTPVKGNRSSLQVLWQAAPVGDTKWQVQYQTNQEARTSATRPTVGSSPGIRGYFYKATLTGLQPGSEFAYQVYKEGSLVFASKAKAPAGPGQDFSAVIFGDFGDDGREEAAIARQALLRRPDLAVIPGDIVYPKGRLSEFRQRLFPVLNSAQAPLMRSVPVAASLGNHDVAAAGEPEGLAYFYLFSHPGNGPAQRYNAAPTVARLAGGDFGQRGNYSFELGDAIWIGLDSNPNIQWGSGPPRVWLKQQLEAAKHKKWKFLFFHHPPFHSSKTHRSQRWMSTIAPVLSKYKVDVVFSGHVHNYQRSRPIFAGDGSREIDRSFDGRAQAKPNGTIYLVTGGGGAGLYDKKQEKQPSTWEPYTVVFKAQHSFTNLRVEGSTLSFQQVNAKGEVIDSFRIAK